VAGVFVMMDGQESGEEIVELILIKEGEPFSLKKISQSIKQIYKTGLFSNVQVSKEGDQEILLTFHLTRRRFIRKIVFKGNNNFSSKKLKDGLLSLREGSFFMEKKLSRTIEELKKALNREGYFNPEIKVYTERVAKSSSVDVFFEIHSARKFIIRKIAFSGEKILREAELKKEMKSKEGKVYIPSVFDEDITRLQGIYDSMNYLRAEIEVEEKRFDEKKGLVDLTLKVIPHEKIEIIVKGAQVPLDLLKPIWEARIFEDWGLREGHAKILGYMRKKGYLLCSVKPFIEKVDNELRIIYEVTPKHKYKIQEISFEGLKYFTPYQLEKELGFLGKTPFMGRIDGARLFDLPEEIVFLYKIKGFPNTRVSFTFPSLGGKKVKALINIEEGIQEKIEKIDFQGVRSVDRKTILEQIGSFEGGPFFQLNVQKDIGKLESYYRNRGMRGTEIEARVERTGEDLFSVVFAISEGKKVGIENIVITGNVVTKRSVIIRELRIKEGDYAFYEKIRESKMRLENLGVFTQVKIEEIPISSEKENLVINVREGERNYAALGIGLETKTEPQSFRTWNTAIIPRGTAEYIRSNIFGSAAQLSLIGQFSLREKRGVISWEQPYFFGQPMKTYLNAWLEREERKSFSYERRGISLTGINSVSENMMLLMTLRWVRTELLNLKIEPSEVDRQHSPFSATSVSGGFIWDRRDDPFNPAAGSFLSFAFEWAYPLFKVKSYYLKGFLKHQQFIPVFPRVTFSCTSRLGMGEGKIPIHERFFAGGSNSFRGAEFDELGPKDSLSQIPVGGKALFLLNLELSFPLLSAVKNLSGVVFYDKGSVFTRVKDLSLSRLRDALGLGIRYRTPLGPVRLELGWNLNPREEEKSFLAFITIGNVF
jgi:outer membrane protein assembly complex protein YaeT